MKRHGLYLDVALVAALAALTVTPAAAQTGPEQTQRFLKTVESAVKAIGESRTQLQKVVATYNSITEMTAKDLKSAFKDLARDITDSEKKVADGHLKVDEMKTAAAGYFAARNAALQAISDPHPNASAIASLKPEAAKFNARAAAVFAKVDGVTRMFDDYIASMRP